jgi:heterogeneous nuclear ribonucleoprotein A1/A3
MALANKLGGLLKKATSSNPSVYQAIRCMSSKLFVGGSSLFIICICLSKFSVLYDFLIAVNIVAGLSYGTDDHSLRDEFAKYGQVVEGIIPIAALALALPFADQLCFNLSS